MKRVGSTLSKDGAGTEEGAPSNETVTFAPASSLARYYYYQRELNALRAHVEKHLRQYEQSLTPEYGGEIPPSIGLAAGGSADCRSDVSTPGLSLAVARTANCGDGRSETGKQRLRERPPLAQPSLGERRGQHFECVHEEGTSRRGAARFQAPTTVCGGATSGNGMRGSRQVGCLTSPVVEQQVSSSYEKIFLQRLAEWGRQGSSCRGRQRQAAPNLVERLQLNRDSCRQASPIRELTPALASRRRSSWAFRSPSWERSRGELLDDPSSVVGNDDWATRTGDEVRVDRSNSLPAQRRSQIHVESLEARRRCAEDAKEALLLLIRGAQESG